MDDLVRWSCMAAWLSLALGLFNAWGNWRRDVTRVKVTVEQSPGRGGLVHVWIANRSGFDLEVDQVSIVEVESDYATQLPKSLPARTKNAVNLFAIAIEQPGAPRRIRVRVDTACGKTFFSKHLVLRKGQ